MSQSSSSDSFRLKCPHCEKSIRVPKSMAGRKGKCPGCGHSIRIGSPKKKARPQQQTPHDELPVRAARPQRAQPPIVVEHPEVSTIEHGQLAAGGQAAPQTAVQVNVNNKSASNSLGIASMILGIFSFFVCWIPPIGFSLSGLGMLLGIGGLVMSILRKGTGIGYAIAGTAISSIGVILGIIFILMIQTAVDVGDQMVEDLDRIRNEVEQQAEPVGSIDGPEDRRESATEEGANDSSSPPGAGTESDEGPEFHDASQGPLVLGSIQLEVTSVRIGKVDLYRTILRRDSESVDELLTVWVNVANISENKKVDYSGWMSDFASMRDIDADLTDNHGNRYRSSTFGATTAVKGATTSDSIYPGKALDDAIVFELPIDGVEYLDLVLSAKGCKEDGEFRFRIPSDMIERQ